MKKKVCDKKYTKKYIKKFTYILNNIVGIVCDETKEIEENTVGNNENTIIESNINQTTTNNTILDSNNNDSNNNDFNIDSNDEEYIKIPKELFKEYITAQENILNKMKKYLE